VAIVEGTSVSQTIVVFVNQAVTAQAAPDEASATYGSKPSLNTFQMRWQEPTQHVPIFNRVSSLLNELQLICEQNVQESFGTPPHLYMHVCTQRLSGKVSLG